MQTSPIATGPHTESLMYVCACNQWIISQCGFFLGSWLSIIG
jgi:hypothetical protein